MAQRRTISVAKRVQERLTLNGRAQALVNLLNPVLLLNRPTRNLTIHHQRFVKRQDARIHPIQDMITVQSHTKSSLQCLPVHIQH